MSLQTFNDVSARLRRELPHVRDDVSIIARELFPSVQFADIWVRPGTGALKASDLLTSAEQQLPAGHDRQSAASFGQQPSPLDGMASQLRELRAPPSEGEIIQD